LQLLKEVAPRTVHAAIIRESGTGGVGQWAVIQSVASSLAVEISPVDTRDPAEMSDVG
jgi:putative ABC transport system substrate-binding protein